MNDETFYMQPTADNVVIEQAGTVDKSTGGVFLPDTHTSKPQEGKVLAAGPTVLDSCIIPGARVVFRKYAGSEITLDGRTTLIVSERDVLVIVRDSPKIPIPAPDWPENSLNEP